MQRSRPQSPLVATPYGLRLRPSVPLVDARRESSGRAKTVSEVAFVSCLVGSNSDQRRLPREGEAIEPTRRVAWGTQQLFGGDQPRRFNRVASGGGNDQRSPGKAPGTDNYHQITLHGTSVLNGGKNPFLGSDGWFSVWL